MHQRNTLAQRRSSRMLNGGGGNHHVYARGGQIFLEEAGYNLSIVRYRHRYGWMDGWISPLCAPMCWFETRSVWGSITLNHPQMASRMI